MLIKILYNFYQDSMNELYRVLSGENCINTIVLIHTCAIVTTYKNIYFLFCNFEVVSIWVRFGPEKIVMYTWFSQGLMVLKWTQGMILVLQNHTHTRGLSIARMLDFFLMIKYTIVFSLGPAPRPGQIMVLMCLSVCVSACLSPQ